MSEAALLAVPRPFVFKGKRYAVAIRDLLIELAFADWVGAEAGLALARMQPRWPMTFFESQMRILNSKIISKQIRWGSEDVHYASFSEEGQRQLLYLKMMRGTEHGGEPLERDLIDEIAKDKAKYAELLRIMTEQDYPYLLEAEAKKKASESESEAASTAPTPIPTSNPPDNPPSPGVPSASTPKA